VTPVSSPEVRLATPADRDRVIATVVAAFADDPAFDHFFPGSYATDAPVFAGNLFDRRVDFGTVWVVDDGSAVSMWNPPGAPHFDVSAGLSTAAQERLERYDALVHGITPAHPHWYLGVLATHPDHAGRRWGRLAMDPGLERARGAGLPAYLETVTEANTRIYTASGWSLVDTVTVDELFVRVMRH
jgi:ribosomal protein S18 acetylase RimI-like enzyme